MKRLSILHSFIEFSPSESLVDVNFMLEKMYFIPNIWGNFLG